MAIALDLELLDSVDYRVVRHLPRLRLQHGDTVEQIFVGSRSPAVDARQDGIRRQYDARDDGGQHDEQTSVQRQLHDLLILDDRPEARGLHSHNRRVCDDRHLLSNVSDTEIEIDARLFARRETDAFVAKGLESRELKVEAVRARSEAGHGVDAIASGDDHSLQIHPRFRDRNRRAGNGSPSRILHKTGDFAGSCLRTGGHHRGAEHIYDRQTHQERCAASDSRHLFTRTL